MSPRNSVVDGKPLEFTAQSTETWAEFLWRLYEDAAALDDRRAAAYRRHALSAGYVVK